MRNSLWLGTALALVLGTSSIALAQQGQQQQGARQGQQMQAGQQQLQQQAQQLKQYRQQIEQGQEFQAQPITQAKTALSEMRQSLAAMMGQGVSRSTVDQLTNTIDEAEESLEKAITDQDKEAAVAAIILVEEEYAGIETAMIEGGAQTATTQAATAGADEAEGAEIAVQQPAPEVMVQQPAPDITVQQPSPDVTVTQAQPEVTVQQPEPEVSVSQAEPQVQVDQAGEADVQVQQAGEPQVRVVTPATGVDVERGTETATAETDTAIPAATDEPEVMVEEQTAAITPGAGLAVAQVENLIGETVVGMNGNELGEISDLLLDRASGEVTAVIIDRGGFLGIGEKQIMIPWSQAQYDQTEGTVMVSMTDQQIDAIPEFNYESIEQGMVGLRERP